MERNEEEFAKFLQTFTQDVWTQLMKVSQAPGQVRALHCTALLCHTLALFQFRGRACRPRHPSGLQH
jgi:hypothetical protein